ncbi:MAG: RHS repeat-associated core domain-containing protein [Bryobacteraceae bacterium]
MRKFRLFRLTPPLLLASLCSAAVDFSWLPTDAEIGRAQIFDLPLRKIDTRQSWYGRLRENRSLAQALREYSATGETFEVERFLADHPGSGWAPSLTGNLGAAWRRQGRIAKGLDAFEQVWRQTRQAEAGNGKAIADWAVGELADMHSHLGHSGRVEEILAEVQGRKIMGAATERLTSARESLWRSREHPEDQYRCGPMAVASLLRRAGREVPEFVLTAKASRRGMSMVQVQTLAREAGLALHAVKRQPGSGVPVPSVVHWKVDHYTAIIDRRVEDGRELYLVENPLFEKLIWTTREVLDEETSGYALTPLPIEHAAGWAAATPAETGAVWGRCWNGGLDLLELMLTALQVAACGAASAVGMTQYSFHAMLVSLHLEDVPVGYSPPVGPPVFIQMSYNQRDDQQPPPAMFAYSNFGPKWTSNWISYITDDGRGASRGAVLYLRGGGAEAFDRRPNNRVDSFGVHISSQAELVGTGPRTSGGLLTDITGYERRMPDGSREIYGLAEPLSSRTDTERRVYLTEVIDPAGNAVKLSYDAMYRITGITDAIGQVTRISYESGDPFKVTKVTDPFGRSAAFSYDGSGLLRRITDVIGIVSEFSYDGDFVTALTTPYGTTQFRAGLLDIHPSQQRFAEINRWLEATDPAGDTERLELRSDTESWPGARENQTRPSAITYYWDKQAWKNGGRVDENAHTYRWMLVENTRLSGYPRWEKPALSGQVNYAYPRSPERGDLFDMLIPPNSPGSGADGLPTIVSAQLDDGAAHVERAEYNVRGNPVKVTDAAGRTYSYRYDATSVDLLEFRNDTANERLALFTYNSQHRPLTYVDAAGQTARFTYNQRGQILSATNAKDQTTRYAYDGNGYLTTVTGPIPQAVIRYAYDNAGRVASVTGTDGYQLTFEYDALDRLVKTTYPDGTVSETRYDRLDASELIDRRGRSTAIAYDSVRRPVSVTDAFGRTASMSWCGCGAANELTDPAGNVTRWQRDIEGRATEKILPGGATTRMNYSTISGRLLSVVDASGESTHYEYTVDGQIRRISYEGAAAETSAVNYSYDETYGRLTRVVDGERTIDYEYAPVGAPGALQLAAVSGPVAGARTAFHYDELGRLAGRDINGAATRMRYDTLGRLVRLDNPLGAFEFGYAGATGRRELITYPSGQRARFGYFDNIGDRRLRVVRHEAADGGVLSQFGYEYETTGEIRAQYRFQPEFPNAQTAYAYRYDDAGRLVAATLGAEDGSILATHDFGYDDAGNRLTENITAGNRAASFNAANQILSLQGDAGGRDFAYDSNGNLASDGLRAYEWDARNRLVAIERGGRRSEFRYDAFDRRIRIIEKDGGNVIDDTELVWCGGAVCEQWSAGSALKRFSQFGEQVGERSMFYTRDHLGSVRQMVRSDGSVGGSFDYDPWGRVTEAASDLEPSFGYTGHWRHRPSELLLAQYRAYDPDTARWLSRDPIAEDGGLNLYEYAQNDPIGYVDPDGRYAGSFEVGLGGYFYPAGGGGSGQLKLGVAFGNASDGRFPVQIIFGPQAGFGVGEGGGGFFNVGGSLFLNPRATIDQHVAGKNLTLDATLGALLLGGTGGLSVPTQTNPDGTTSILWDYTGVTFNWTPQVGGGGKLEVGQSNTAITAFGQRPPTPLFKLSASEDHYIYTAPRRPRTPRRRRPPLRGSCRIDDIPPTVNTEVTGQLVSEQVAGQLLTPVNHEPSGAGSN